VQFDCLFDIAHADAFTMIHIEEDRKFLIDQQSERKMFISSEDRELANRKHVQKRDG